MAEKEFINRAKLNDDFAFEQLVHLYKPYVEKLAFQFGMRPDSIPDVVQDTFIKIHQNIRQFERGKFSTWVYQITLNTVRDHYRKKQREWRIFQRAAEEERLWLPGNFRFTHENHDLLHKAMKKLDEKYRIPIILFYFHNRSYEEIGIIMNIKLSTVKTRMYRGRERLKVIYEKLEREEAEADGRQTFG